MTTHPASGKGWDNKEMRRWVSPDGSCNGSGPKRHLRKFGYATKSKAKRALRQTGFAGSVYKCIYCEFWHTSSQRA